MLFHAKLCIAKAFMLRTGALLFAVLLSLIVTIVTVTTTVTTAHAEGSRVAVVDWREALLASEQGNAFRQRIEQQLGKDQKKLVQMKQSLVALQDQIKKDKDTISKAKLEKLTERFGKELGAYEQLNAQVGQRQMQLEEAFIKSAEPKIVQAIAAISKQQKFDLVIDRQAALHVGKELDITETLRQKLNQ